MDSKSSSATYASELSSVPPPSSSAHSEINSGSPSSSPLPIVHMYTRSTMYDTVIRAGGTLAFNLFIAAVTFSLGWRLFALCDWPHRKHPLTADIQTELKQHCFEAWPPLYLVTLWTLRLLNSALFHLYVLIRRFASLRYLCPNV